MHSLDWFWQTDRVIAVLHIAGARGAAIHQLITYSPEVDKRKNIEVWRGVAHINQEGLGYRVLGDMHSQYQMYEHWSAGAQGTFPRSMLATSGLERIRDEISRLYTRSGDTLPESVAKGFYITYRNHPAMDDGGAVWPNRRVVAVHNGVVGNSLRDYYLKQLTREPMPWQRDHLCSLGYDGMAESVTIMDYYTVAHCGLEPDATGHRTYLRQCIDSMARNRDAMLSADGCHVIDADHFFAGDNWRGGYESLCDYCGITPAPDLAAEFMEVYMAQQWNRADA